MDNTTQNSGALSELRPAKYPVPDGNFFSAFVPELIFSLVVWLIAALAYFHFSRLVSRLSDGSTGSDAPFDGKILALKRIDGLDTNDPRYSELVWLTVREYLATKLGNPLLPNMTASEAVAATRSIRKLEPLAYLARELEYSKTREDSELNENLWKIARDFLNSL